MRTRVSSPLPLVEPVSMARGCLLHASLTAIIAACGDGTGPGGSSIAEVRVSSDAEGTPVLVGERPLVRASLWDAEGNQLPLLDSLGRQIPGREISWFSADESKAQVSGQGPVQRTAVVTAIATGAVAIHATAGGREGTIQVVVLPQAASMRLHPSRLGIVPTGESRITHEFLDADGDPLDNFPRTPIWATSDPGPPPSRPALPAWRPPSRSTCRCSPSLPFPPASTPHAG